MFKSKFFIAILLLLTAVYSTSCKKANENSASSQKPLILVSIAPYQFIVERIAGNSFDILTVVPQGANPHAYEPTSKQAQSISKGTIWFTIGEPFEKKLLSVLKTKNRSLIEADLRQGIELLEDHTSECSHCSIDHQDRHIWLSPKLASVQADTIARVLGEKFPEKKEIFLENGKILSSELKDLDQEIASVLAAVKERVVLVSHPAFGYFCRDYNFEQLSVEFEGKDPRPRHLEEVIQKALSQSAELALALPQHNNKGAQLIAERLHIPVKLIDPYSPDYFEMLRLLARLIADPKGQE